MEKEIDVSVLEKILKKTTSSIEKSKEQIFEISEDARTEKEKILINLDHISREINKVIADVDKLEIEYNRSRNKLVMVSKNFKNYAEKDIQKAYEDTNKLQIDLFMSREREVHLKTRRNELQMRLKNLDITIERADGLITQMGVVFNYLTNDIAKFTELAESAKLRQMFGLKIIQAQEEERKRVARDIHDGPAQSMANVVLRTEIAERLMNNQQKELAIKELKDLKTMIRTSLADVRQIIFDLRPMALDDLGLLPTLRKYIPEIAKRENLNIELNFSGKERRLASGMEVAIFRLIQEILNNIVKHAKADLVQAMIEYGEKNIKVMVKDNGIGFKEEEVMRDENKFGLMGMKERIELLEGEFEINSSKNIGTKITFSIPINESEETSDGSNKN